MKKPDNRKQLGQVGENLAAYHLEALGLNLVQRNWRARSGEIDIIAEEGETLVFVEVRTRRLTGTFGLPEESVDHRKQRQVRETAMLYMHATGLHNRKCRFDVVAVKIPVQGGEPVIRHIPSAF